MKLSLAIVLALICFCGAFSQTDGNLTEPSGSITGQIFVNYHYDLTENAEKNSQFEILRSNFGYVYTFNKKLTSRFTIDAANDGKAFSVFLKAASLEWKVSKVLTVEGGMMKTFMFDTQEDLWGNRFVMETVQDRSKFYTLFDLGFKASWKPADFLQLRVGIFNGEGFKKLQDNFGVQRKTFDMILYPIAGLTFKAYYDFMPKRDTSIFDGNLLATQSTSGLFIGFDKPGKFRMGLGYDVQNGHLHFRNHNLTTISGFGAVTIGKIELFTRFDQLSSNSLREAVEALHIARDYSLIMGGIRTTITKGIRTSLNFSHYIPEESGNSPADLVYLNLEIKF